MSEDWKYEPAHDFGLPARERARSLRREAGLGSFLTHAAWWAAMRAYLAIAHRLSISGRGNLPATAPFLLVANHSSHLDALVLGSALPARYLGRVFPIAAGDTFFENALVASFATTCMNALPIWRQHCGTHSLDELRRRLVEERAVFILFPEGTRTRTGRLGAFKPGFGRFVCETDVPVVPCYLTGAWEAFPPSRKMPRPGKVALRIGQPLTFYSEPNNREGWRNATNAVEAAIRRLATPATG